MIRALRLVLPLLLALFLAPALAAAQTVDPWREGDRIVGATAAPVTMTVYVSTTCGHCANWHNQAWPAFRAKYVETGQVRVVFRDLPTPPEDIAIAGAVMARCAPAERFDAALDALYSRQGLLAGSRPEPLTDRVADWLIGAAKAGNLTQEQAMACFEADANWVEIAARADQAVADGVEGTPTFFVNGERVLEDAHSLDVAAFDAVIQPLLAGR